MHRDTVRYRRTGARSYGCTRLEIGVQSVYEDVARDTNRGHTVRVLPRLLPLGTACLCSMLCKNHLD